MKNTLSYKVIIQTKKDSKIRECFKYSIKSVGHEIILAQKNSYYYLEVTRLLDNKKVFEYTDNKAIVLDNDFKIYVIQEIKKLYTIKLVNNTLEVDYNELYDYFVEKTQYTNISFTDYIKKIDQNFFTLINAYSDIMHINTFKENSYIFKCNNLPLLRVVRDTIDGNLSFFLREFNDNIQKNA